MAVVRRAFSIHHIYGANETRHELAAGFNAGLFGLTYRWDQADPRPRGERQAALFDFVFQTYDSSAWIPQSLFDSNLLTQVVLGEVDTIVRDRAGLVLWPGNPLVPALGMAPNAGTDQPLAWTVNCLVCHTAEIDGVAYVGAGTKTFDDVRLADALKVLTSAGWRGFGSGGDEDRLLAADANRILRSHHHDKIDSLTRGRSTAFAAAPVELYMRPHNGEMPAVEDVGRGDVKTPPLWHTAAKMSSGRWYTDGSFHGRIPLLASSMELEKDQTFAALADTVIPQIEKDFASVIQHLRPPRYPYPINRELASEGRALFHSPRLRCSQCHGSYDGAGNVHWPGIHIDVGTDAARLNVVSDNFVDTFDRSPIAAYGTLKKSEGYAATPLTGVWANYPYLHNGSVPTLYHLLGPVHERPRIFEVRAARHFDQERVGQLLSVDPRHRRLDEVAVLRRFGRDREWFNTQRPGSGNGGHDYWAHIRTDENRRALIEYLKTI